MKHGFLLVPPISPDGTWGAGERAVVHASLVTDSTFRPRTGKMERIHQIVHRGSQGVQQRNFAVSVVQPGDKVAIEIEFNEKVHGLSGDTVWLSLEDDTSLEDAEALRALLERIGHRITVTNVRS